MNNNYPLNIGALFKNQCRKTKKAPVLTGTIDLDRSLVTHLYRQLESGKRARLTLGGWKNTSKTGKAYFTIKATKPFVPQESGVLLDDDDDGLDL
jgi:hypothetical protein